MQTSLRLALVPGFVVLCSLSAAAQFDNQWATFVRETNRIKNPDGSIATQVTNDIQDKDYAYGDLDRDGWTDLVVTRKNAGDAYGLFADQLLMNWDQIRELKVPVIFGSEVFLSDVLAQIAEETGARYEDTLRDDDLPGAPGDAEHSWIGLMRYDYVTMIKGLGGTAPTLEALDVADIAPDSADYPQ
jgi:hypothetical protein